MNHTPSDLLNQLESLTDIVSMALVELNDQDTGYYYQLQREMQKSRLMIRRAKGELK